MSRCCWFWNSLRIKCNTTSKYVAVCVVWNNKLTKKKRSTKQNDWRKKNKNHNKIITRLNQRPNINCAKQWIHCGNNKFVLPYQMLNCHHPKKADNVSFLFSQLNPNYFNDDLYYCHIVAKRFCHKLCGPQFIDGSCSCVWHKSSVIFHLFYFFFFAFFKINT